MRLRGRQLTPSIAHVEEVQTEQAVVHVEVPAPSIEDDAVTAMRYRFVNDGAFEVPFGPLSMLQGGLRGVIGLPAPFINGSVLHAMEREHCKEVDSVIEFTTSNSHFSATTSRTEWVFVASPDQSELVDDGRWPMSMDLLHRRLDERNALASQVCLTELDDDFWG